MRQASTLLFVPLTLAILIFGCQNPPSTLTESQKGAIADTLRGITREMAAGANALDVDRSLNYLTNDADLTFMSDAKLFPPKDSLTQLYHQVYSTFRSMEFIWDSSRVAVLDRDAGVVSSTGHFTVTDKSGKKSNTIVATTYVFQRRNGSWKLIHGHASHAPATN